MSVRGGRLSAEVLVHSYRGTCIIIRLVLASDKVSKYRHQCNTERMLYSPD